jgi:rod shape-determining protein MreC
MESVLGRYRNLIVLTAVLFLQVLGLAVQVKRTNDTESTRLIRVWAVSAVTPFEKALVWTQTSTRNIWHNYFYLRGVRAENRELKAEIERMRLEQVRMSQDADQARRLQALLGFKEQFISQTLAAQVIGFSGSEQSQLVYIDKGARDGVKPDMAVISNDGIVGKVLRVYGSNPLEAATSQVLLVNDQTSGVGAILEKSRLQGILRGTPSGEIVLEKVMSDETVAPGERVLTSGGDRIFPKGLPIGTVTQVSRGSDVFLNIRIKPFANLSKLEEVLVVTKVDEKQTAPEITGPVRASDILAERLPTVPPKPETPTGAASGPPGTKPDGVPAASGSKPAPKPGAAPVVGMSPSPQSAAHATVPANKTSTQSGSANTAGNSEVKSKPAAIATTNGSASTATKPVAKTATPTATGGSDTNSDTSVNPTAKISPGAVKADVPAKPQAPPDDNPR